MCYIGRDCSDDGEECKGMRFHAGSVWSVKRASDKTVEFRQGVWQLLQGICMRIEGVAVFTVYCYFVN